MTNKEISIRSIVFLIIGILLVLSLVICINIVNGEKDLVATNATVIKIKDALSAFPPSKDLWEVICVWVSVSEKEKELQK